MKMLPCPHCNANHHHSHAEQTYPEYNYELDEYREGMFCSTCDGKWVRIYKPSHDIKEE